MAKSSEYRDYEYILEVLASEETSQLEELTKLLEEFPNGVDEILGCHWITNAVECGSRRSIEWMLNRKVDLSIRDAGYTVLHTVLERRAVDQLDIMVLLIRHGAPINAHGINDWTPAHMAAVHDNTEALRLLVDHGADLSIRTRIDDYATPLEEARLLHRSKAVTFLEALCRPSTFGPPRSV